MHCTTLRHFVLSHPRRSQDRYASIILRPTTYYASKTVGQRRRNDAAFWGGWAGAGGGTRSVPNMAITKVYNRLQSTDVSCTILGDTKGLHDVYCRKRGKPTGSHSILHPGDRRSRRSEDPLLDLRRTARLGVRRRSGRRRVSYGGVPELSGLVPCQLTGWLSRTRSTKSTKGRGCHGRRPRPSVEVNAVNNRCLVDNLADTLFDNRIGISTREPPFPPSTSSSLTPLTDQSSTTAAFTYYSKE